MSFLGILAPLYLAGLAALAIPIVLHFIRRSPKGKVPFSTLMFLESSPPRMTRRSRLDNLLLLLIRALAITLIVIAFCRPFFRSDSQEAGSAGNGRLIAILVDQSASMQRGDLWQQAMEEIDKVLDETSEADRICLMTFDNQPHTIVDFSELDQASENIQTELIRDAVKSISPSWHATDTGAALVAACGLLSEQNTLRETGEQNRMQVILISDLQTGSNFSALQAFEWPEVILLSTRELTVPGSNAGVNVLQSAADDEEDERLRVRLSNSNDAMNDQFSIRWHLEGELNGQTDNAQDIQVQVPAGQSRVVRLRPLPDGQTPVGIELFGDGEEFDNVFYLPTKQKSIGRIEFVENKKLTSESGLQFFFESLFASDESEVVAVDSKKLLASGVVPNSIVVADEIPNANDRVLEFVRLGGRALIVVSSIEMQPTLRSLLDDEELTLTEATVDRFTLFSDIDFKHPVFEPFADPKFSDFTTGRFWKYRKLSSEQVTKSDENDSLQIVASFDTGDPALIHRTLGRGEMYVLMSGWNPQDSQLAVWNKFVPLTMKMLGKSGGRDSQEWSFVGERVSINQRQTAGQKPDQIKLTKPSGDTMIVSADAGATLAFAPDSPGLYRGEIDGEAISLAVNLDSRESMTEPIDVEELIEYRVQMGSQATAEEVTSHKTQMRNQKLEQTQRVWSWLILAALGLLFAETIIAGWLARRGNQALVGA